MKKPELTPLDPTSPRTKQVTKIPMPQLYPQSMEDDVYIRPDNDSVYVPIDILNRPIEQSFIENSIQNLVQNEDTENSN